MSGVGNPLHLTMEMLKVATGIDIQAVPYRGDAPIMTALVAGECKSPSYRWRLRGRSSRAGRSAPLR
jgi:tripartite-type tricarboxylate transporter receptor subunit TctC